MPTRSFLGRRIATSSHALKVRTFSKIVGNRRFYQKIPTDSELPVDKDTPLKLQETTEIESKETAESTIATDKETGGKLADDDTLYIIQGVLKMC